MGNAKQVLAELIEKRLQPGADVAAIDRQIWALFGETWAVMLLDMAGFTKRTEEFGILHFLTLIHEMERLVRPIILAHYGFVLKKEADSLFVIFRDPEHAVRCAMEMQSATAHYNINHPVDAQVLLCIGIGYGQVLKIGDEDCFGSEVNFASKLGEDTACAYETLLTPGAHAAVSHLGFEFQEITLAEGDKTRTYYQLKNEE